MSSHIGEYMFLLGRCMREKRVALLVTLAIARHANEVILTAP